MSKEKIYFRGFLTNTDSSILKINLDHGFKIESMSVDEGIRFISLLQNRPYMEVSGELFHKFPIRNNSEDKCYFISNSFECDIGMNDEDRRDRLISERTKFDVTLVQGYLTPIIRLTKLFKEGNVYMPLEFYYLIDNNAPRLFMGSYHWSNYNSRDIFTLKDSKISDFQRFIQNTKLPFKEPFLQLAFENFELSYLTPTTNLTFLSLMISMELLFNPGEELSHRISRNAAVLLGKDFKESENIFSEIKKLYTKRSNIVHGRIVSGKSKTLNNEDVVKLRNYVRESIKEINIKGKSRDELLKFLDSRGYGSRFNESVSMKKGCLGLRF